MLSVTFSGMIFLDLVVHDPSELRPSTWKDWHAALLQSLGIQHIHNEMLLCYIRS